MSIALKMLAVILLVLGVVYGALINPTAIISAKAGDYGGALAAASMRFIPFALAAKWSWNAATGRKTSWALIVILFLWIIAGLHAMGEAQRQRATMASNGPIAPSIAQSGRPSELFS